MQTYRRLARSGAGKQPQQLAFKTPKACHLLTFYNNSSSSSSNSDDDDDDEDGAEDADPNNRYAVPSASTLPPVNPLDVISFQIPSPSPPPPPPEAVAVASAKEIPPPTYLGNDYEDDAMAMDFN